MGGNRIYKVNDSIKFSSIELRDILVSVVALSIAFLLMFRNNNSVTTYFKHTMGDGWMIGMFAMMVAIVVLSFFVHELGHKFTAQKMGLWSEYRMFPTGLIFAVIMGMVGFLFAAPGVVYIQGYVDQEQDGKISIAGPLVNIILSVVGLAGCIICNGSPAVILFYLLFVLNASLALFNLLPIGILDGAKVLRWNSSVWLICIAVAAVLFASRYIGLIPEFGYSL